MFCLVTVWVLCVCFSLFNNGCLDGKDMVRWWQVLTEHQKGCMMCFLRGSNLLETSKCLHFLGFLKEQNL